MKTKLLMIAILISFFSFTKAQSNVSVGKWNWLIGEWVSVNSGFLGDNATRFSFQPDAEKRIVVTKSYFEPTKSASKTKIEKEEKIFVFADANSNLANATNIAEDGNQLNYTVSYLKNSIVMTSERVENAPVYRLTYTLLDNDMISAKIEQSSDGVSFRTKTEMKIKKYKPARVI